MLFDVFPTIGSQSILRVEFQETVDKVFKLVTNRWDLPLSFFLGFFHELLHLLFVFDLSTSERRCKVGHLIAVDS